MMGPLLVGIYVFVLACFVGFEIITKIPPTLHTPLMSGANAISGITLVGSIAAASSGGIIMSSILAFVAYLVLAWQSLRRPESDRIVDGCRGALAASFLA